LQVRFDAACCHDGGRQQGFGRRRRRRRAGNRVDDVAAEKGRRCERGCLDGVVVDVDVSSLFHHE